MTTRKQLAAWQRRINVAQRQIDRLQRRLDARQQRLDAKLAELFPPPPANAITVVALKLLHQGLDFSRPMSNGGTAPIGMSLRIRLPTEYTAE